MKQLLFLIIAVVACKPTGNVGDVPGIGTPITFTARVIDNMTKKPVAGAVLTARGVQDTTNAAGFVQFVAAPKDPLLITHQQYRKLELPSPSKDKFQVAIDLKDDLIEFEGGMKMFYLHFQKTMMYPVAARTGNVQSRIWVEFMIEPDGNSRVVKIYDKSRLFTQEIARVFETMPAGWADKYSGMTFLLPITFLIADAPKPEEFEVLDVPRQRVMSELVIAGYMR